MDALKSQLLRIQEQLSGLSASQKMLTASLVAIMVITILWSARFAGTAQMEPILEQSFTPEDVGQMRLALGPTGIPMTVTGDRVLVPADRRYEALAVLAYNNQLPSNSYKAWDEMLKQSTLWDSSSKTAELHKHMKERLLSDWMSGHFPNVASATVFINDVSKPRLGASLEPTASVMIKTRGPEENIKKMVGAVAAAVASAVSGLTPARVAVIIDGQSHRVPDPSSGFSGEADDKAREWERDKTQKLEMMFPGARIAVAVDVEMTRKLEEIESFDRAKSLIVDNLIESRTQEASQPQSAATDPGTQSNVGLELAPGGPKSNTSTSEVTKTSVQINPGKTTQKIETPAGKATVFSAAIRIPRSDLVRVLGKGDSAAKADDAAIQAQFEKEKPGMVRTAQNAIGMKSDENISIDMFYDDGGPMIAGLGVPAIGGAGFGSVLGNHAREMAVGALAVMSLFMLMTIVRKGSPAPMVPVAEAPRETPRLASGEDVAGIVGDNNTMLDGIEMDESAVKAQQMVDQVSTMVQENPDGAANLVKRWLNRS